MNVLIDSICLILYVINYNSTVCISPACYNSIVCISPACYNSIVCISPACYNSIVCISPACYNSTVCISPACSSSLILINYRKSDLLWQRRRLVRQPSLYTFMYDLTKGFQCQWLGICLSSFAACSQKPHPNYK